MLKKFALMLGIWMFVYPLVTVLFYLMRAYGASLPVPAQTMIATLILVPIMVNWIAPFVKKQVGQMYSLREIDTETGV